MKSHPIISSLLAVVASSTVLFAADPVKPVSPDVALAKLKEGNLRFSTAKVTDGKPVADKRAETAQSQSPFAIVVGCADSRTSPELVFDQNIGDLFVVRTAGHLVAEHSLGSIEYAVQNLGARLIVVLGHERCGAVKAAVGTATAPGNVNSLVRDIQPAVEAAKGKPGDVLDATIKENANLIAAKIRSDSKLGDLAKEIRVVAGVYDLDTGKVEWTEE
jgi:carbonic anhydrase